MHRGFRKEKYTRMHSSRMRTGRSLTICCSLLPGGGLLPGGSALGGCAWSGGGVCSRGGAWLGGVPGLGEGWCA